MIYPVNRWVSDRTCALLCSAGFAVLGIVLAMRFFADQQTPTLRMSAGPDATRRHAVATYLRDRAEENHLNIQLQDGDSSEDCLNQLKAGKLDVAMVCNCVVVPDDEEIMVLGAAQMEAFHVLVRKDLIHGHSLGEIIRGHRVNLGEKGSTEWLLAREALAFAHVKLPSPSYSGDIIPTEYSKDELNGLAQAILTSSGRQKEELIAELPDCLLILDSLPSTVVQRLIEAADYRVMPMPAARAFLMDNLQDSHTSTTMLEREFLLRTEIPARSYFSTQGFPEADCETVGVRLLIVARKDLPARAIRPLMKTIFEGEFSRRIHPTSPRELATPYAIHPAAVAYLDRDKPLAIKEAMEWFNKGLSAFGAFSACALSIYGLLWKKKIRKPSDYFTEIRQIDQIARGVGHDLPVPVEAPELATYLDDRLRKLRQELVEDICEGRIKGDQVIANILTLLSDTRRNLPKGSNSSSEHVEHPLRTYSPTARAA